MDKRNKYKNLPPDMQIKLNSYEEAQKPERFAAIIIYIIIFMVLIGGAAWFIHFFMSNLFF